MCVCVRERDVKGLPFSATCVLVTDVSYRPQPCHNLLSCSSAFCHSCSSPRRDWFGLVTLV